MWRGTDAVYNILGHLVFAVPVEMPCIAYREPPFRGGSQYPPDPPTAGGVYPPPTTPPNMGVGLRPPPQPPPAMRVYQACELFVKS